MDSDLLSRFPALAMFFGGFLNQDLDIIFGSVDSAIAAFLKNADVKLRRRVLDELRQLLMYPRDDHQLSLMVAGLGCDYAVESSETSVRQWLEKLSTTIEASLSQPGR